MLKIRIDTRNDAFQNGNLEVEIEQCLKDVIHKIRGCGYKESNIHDSNGNNVGTFKLTNR